MYPLKVEEAILLVRKNFDEQDINVSDIIDLDDMDSDNLDDLIAKTLPEAINAVHSAAPEFMLDGVVAFDSYDEDSGISLLSDDPSGEGGGEDSGEEVTPPDPEVPEALISAEICDDVLKVTINDEVLRLVNFKTIDSDVTITECYPETSPQARMQRNPYTRATSDRPVLVKMQSKVRAKTTTYSYYTLSEFFSNGIEPLDRVEYIPFYHYEGKESYDVAEMVVDKVINQVTGMCLAVLGNTETAQYFLALASFGETTDNS